MKIEVSPGEAADRASILELKARHFDDAGKRAAVESALVALRRSWSSSAWPPMKELSDWRALAGVNETLWRLESAQRQAERAGVFGSEFVDRARAIYRLNDRRASLKRAIDTALGSALSEPKDYGPAH